VKGDIGKAAEALRVERGALAAAEKPVDSFSDVKQPAILYLSEDTLFAWCHAHPDVGPAFVAAIAPVLTTRSPNAPDRQFHSLVKRLLDEFGDREDVLRTLDRNLNTFGWMGSRSNYYALYEEPLRALEHHPIGAVRRWAKRVWYSFSREIESVRKEGGAQTNGMNCWQAICRSICEAARSANLRC
jgi:hypothetical protein